jgi:serine phosphatase RsbU (regulator of sigma subunit)
MDIGLCHIDLEKARITFAGARRPLYYINGTGEFIEIKGDRQTLGGSKQSYSLPFTNHDIAINGEVICYLTTDGYADQHGSISHKYGTKRLREFLQAHCQLTMKAQHQALIDELAAYQGEEPQRDDISMLGIKIKSKSSQ